MQISRIRLSDKISRLHPRLVAASCCQSYETEVPVEVREWIGPAPAPSDFVLVAQPPAQPRCGVVVERAVRLVDAAYLKYSPNRATSGSTWPPLPWSLAIPS